MAALGVLLVYIAAHYWLLWWHLERRDLPFRLAFRLRHGLWFLLYFSWSERLAWLGLTFLAFLGLLMVGGDTMPRITFE